MGILQKAAGFLGIDKFGKGLASAGRVISGTTGQERQIQQQADASVQKLVYAARQETNPEKKTRLLQMANKLSSGTVAENQIDPGLNLTNKEILSDICSASF